MLSHYQNSNQEDLPLLLQFSKPSEFQNNELIFTGLIYDFDNQILVGDIQAMAKTQKTTRTKYPYAGPGGDTKSDGDR